MSGGTCHFDIKGTKVEQNLNISRALFVIVFDCLTDAFDKHGDVIHRSDLVGIRQRFEESWHHIESLFDNTCSRCQDLPWYVRDDRRQDSLTRLIYVRIAMNVSERTSRTGDKFPAVVIPGLQKQVAVMLFLLSPESSNLTGANYATDGGFTTY